MNDLENLKKGRESVPDRVMHGRPIHFASLRLRYLSLEYSVFRE